jgi:lysophospholipase L1-like esterase
LLIHIVNYPFRPVLLPLILACAPIILLIATYRLLPPSQTYEIRSLAYYLRARLLIAFSPQAPPEPGILCLGDSMTAGEGIGADESYPHYLSEIAGEPCINLGVGGHKTLDGLKRIPQDLAGRLCKTVIIQYGGNDYKVAGVGRRQIERNLRRIARCVKRLSPSSVVYCLGAPTASDTSGPDFTWLPADLTGIPIDPATRHFSAEGNRILAERIWRELP